MQQDNVSIPKAPAIPGLTFRHFRGDEDFPAILDVNTLCKIEDGLENDRHTLDTIKYVYSPGPGYEPERDMLIGEVNGRVVSYSRVFWERLQEDGSRIYWHVGFVLPEWRGKGIGKAQVAWAEQRAWEIEAAHEPVEGEGPAYLSAEPMTEPPPKGGHSEADLLIAAGYEPVRYRYFMETDGRDHIPEVPLPEGLEIRPALPEHYRAIWEANQEAFQDHWGSSETEEGGYEHFLANPRTEPRLWVVAWDGDQVAGSILNFIDREYNQRSGRSLGYTEWITVRRPWRRRGLARAMLARSMQVHKDEGMTQTALGVDTENPSGALQLYRSMGYKVISEFTTFRKAL